MPGKAHQWPSSELMQALKAFQSHAKLSNGSQRAVEFVLEGSSSVIMML